MTNYTLDKGDKVTVVHLSDCDLGRVRIVKLPENSVWRCVVEDDYMVAWIDPRGPVLIKEKENV